MYTLLVKPDDTLVATNRENIYHRTSLIHNLRFLVDAEYKHGNEVSDIRSYVCTLEYKTPISDTYVPVILSPSLDLYKGKVEYLLPVNTSITSEVGNVELKLTWVKLSMNNDGSFNEQVRKTPATTIEVLPVAQWSDYIADSKLDNIAQMLLASQSQAEQMKVYADQIQALGQMFMVTKADNISYDNDTNTLQLQSMGSPIGQPVVIDDCECEEGIPVVDFNDMDPETPDEPNQEIDNVVDFTEDQITRNTFNNVVDF